MSDELPVSDENAAIFEVWISPALQGASPAAAVTLESWTNARPPRCVDLSTLGPSLHALPLGPARPFVRLKYHGYAPADGQAVPGTPATSKPLNCNRLRVEVEDHRVIRTPKGLPVIELFAASELIGRGHFRDVANLPEPQFKREARAGVIDLFYELDLLDMVLSRKREPVWSSEECGLEA